MFSPAADVRLPATSLQLPVTPVPACHVLSSSKSWSELLNITSMLYPLLSNWPQLVLEAVFSPVELAPYPPKLYCCRQRAAVVCYSADMLLPPILLELPSNSGHIVKITPWHSVYKHIIFTSQLCITQVYFWSLGTGFHTGTLKNRLLLQNKDGKTGRRWQKENETLTHSIKFSELIYVQSK